MADIPLVGTPDVPQQVDVGDLGASEIEKSGDMIGGAFQGAGSEALSLKKQQSRAIMFNQIASYSSAVNQARLALVGDPSDTNIAAQSDLVKKMYDTSTTMDGMSMRDQASLSRTMQSIQNTFNIEAGMQSKKNQQSQMLSSFNQSSPSSLQQIAESYATNDGKSDGLFSDYTSQVNDLLKNGAITNSAYKNIMSAATVAQQRGKMLSQSGGSYVGTVGGINTEKNIGLFPSLSTISPQDQNSSTLTGIANSEFTLDDAKQDAMNGHLDISFLSDPHLTSNQVNQVYNTYQGAAQAKAVVAKGVNYNNLQNQIKIANQIKNPGSIQEAYRNTLTNLNNQMKNDFYTFYTTNTSNGQSALNQFNTDITNVQQNAVLTPQAKQSQINNLQDQFVNNVVSFGSQHGVPSQYLKPFPASDPAYTTLQNSFGVQGDVGAGLSVINSGSKLVPYYLKTLASPIQSAAANLAFLNKSNTSAQAILLLANKNQNSSLAPVAKIVDTDGKVISDSDVLSSLYKNGSISSYMSYLQNQQDGQTQIGATQKALVNTVKYYMNNNSNTSLDAAAAKVSSFIPSNVSTGSLPGGKFSFMGLPNLNNSDMNAVANLALTKAYQKMATTLQAAGVQNYQPQLNALRETNSLSVTNSSNGFIQVYNHNTGQLISELPYNSTLLNLARTISKSSQLISSLSSGGPAASIGLGVVKDLFGKNS